VPRLALNIKTKTLMKSNMQTDWPSDMDHCVADAVPLLEPVVIGERAYAVPREVTEEINRLRTLISRTETTKEIEARQLILALGSCFHRHEDDGGLVFNYPENTRLKFIIGELQETQFKQYVAP